MEPFEVRLKRFLDDKNEVPLTILQSINTHFLSNIRVAKEKELDSLIFLGIHATIQTVSEKIFGKYSKEGTKFYLEHFVDGSIQNRQFSLISDEIHEMRNVMAHQWLSLATHNMVINYNMPEGWKREGNLLYINPDIYAEQFLAGFSEGSIWKYDEHITPNELIIHKYKFIKDWLELDNKDEITKEIQILKPSMTEQEIFDKETIIKDLIYK